MPSSRQLRMTRSAISPRLTTRALSRGATRALSRGGPGRWRTRAVA
ncbi:hypothetical protein [Actinoalloteichus sp. AHMU CJ021]